MASSVHADKNRKRGAPLSCAECRRLKLRCSRVFPCASCVKKGCAAICPDGSLTTGRGNRFVLANTEVLHEKILVLSTRVRDLEVALAEAHQGRSGDTHPLLTPELLQLKRPLEREAPEAPRDQETEVAEVLDAVGSLSLTEHGHTRFYGTAANAWYLLQNEEGGGDEAESVEIALPSDIPWLGHGFPFTSASETRLHVRTFLLSQLPEHTKARHLVDIYYRHCGWMYTPLPETELYANVFSRIYDQTIAIDQDPTDSHRLAVLYMVFALGTLMDLDQPYLSTQSTQYYQLARAALSLDSVLENQSIPAIQALLLMCHFMFLSFRDGPRWALMGLVVKLAQGLGLHRDSGNWNLSAEETFKRRSLLWEIYVYDSWQSLTYGRPPSFANAFIDCQMPEPDPPTSADNPKDLEISYSAWKHRFASRCLSIVHEQAFGARTPSYKVIQQLDKKVKEWPVPPMLQVPGFGEAKTMELTAPPIELTMQRYIVFAIREITIFYLHRGFFARAIEDSPEDPLGSKYAPSVLAAYNSARTFVGLVKSLHSQHPKLTERHWFLFTHVFSCAIVLGSIAAKCPGMPFARTALTNLDSAYSLFEVVRENDRALKVLPTLQKLRNKALVVMNSYTGAGPLPSLRSSPGAIKEEDDAELAALRGKTRLVSRKSPSLPSSPHDSNSNGTPSPKSSPVQRYSMDHGHLTHDTIMIHGTPDHSNNWQVYSQAQENGYGPYYATPSTSQTQWSPETEYPTQPNHSPNLLMNPASFHAYEQFPMNQPSYIPSRSPLEPTGPPDVSSAWQSFIAQYDQPGMVG